MVAARQTLQIRQKQTIALTPSMRHSLQLLRLPALDLIQEISRASDENPFLLVNKRSSGAGLASAFDVALDTVAAKVSIGESLRQQIGAMTLSPEIRAMAEYLTGELRPDGYLDAAIDEIADTTGVAEPIVLAGLEALQRCEPSGVGARDLAECLELQLLDHGLARAMARRVVARLNLFAEARWKQLERELDLPRSELQRIGAALRDLDPHPVHDPEDLAPPLLPDVQIEPSGEGGFTAALTRQGDPGISLNTALIAQFGDSDDPFVTSSRQRAEALIRAVKARGATLLRIGQQIATRQAGFFRQGAAGLAPMSRQQMADELGLHPSTLGRAVAGKALEFDGKLYPLELFFSVGLPKKGDHAISSHAVRQSIRRLIDAETPGAPLSDQRICEILRKDGVDISRRTVAKYRGCMRIPSSSERRRHRG